MPILDIHIEADTAKDADVALGHLIELFRSQGIHEAVSASPSFSIVVSLPNIACTGQEPSSVVESQVTVGSCQ